MPGYLAPDLCHFLCPSPAWLQTLLGGHYTCQHVCGLTGMEEWCGVVWATGGQAALHVKLLTWSQSGRPASADLDFAEASLLGQPDDMFWG